MSQRLNSTNKLSNVRFDEPDFHYPSCPHQGPTEVRIYARLRSIYEHHAHTWDTESKHCWFNIIIHPAVTKTSLRGAVYHRISIRLNKDNTTWAKVVYLKEIYGEVLFQSKTLVAIILSKYPSAKFDSYDFDPAYEDYPDKRISVNRSVALQATYDPFSMAPNSSATSRASEGRPSQNFPVSIRRGSIFGSALRPSVENDIGTLSHRRGDMDRNEVAMGPTRRLTENWSAASIGFHSGVRPSEQQIVNEKRTPLHQPPLDSPFNPEEKESKPLDLSCFEYRSDALFPKRLKREQCSQAPPERAPNRPQDSEIQLALRVMSLEMKLASMERRFALQSEDIQSLRNHNMELLGMMTRVDRAITAQEQARGPPSFGEGFRFGMGRY